MPIYEYQCEKCRRVLNFLVRNIAQHKPPACPKCGHAKMSRRMSLFSSASARKGSASASDAGGGDDLGDIPDLPGLDGLDENDPKSMGRFMRNMAKEMGEPLDTEMEEVCKRLEAGDDPEKIEEDLAEEPGDSGPGGAGGDSKLYDA